MTDIELADELDAFNAWRRGNDEPQPDPKAVGLVIEQAAKRLRKQAMEIAQWKNHHETEVRRARILKERTDMPIERVQAYDKWGDDLLELGIYRDRQDMRFSIHGAKKVIQLRGQGFTECGIAMERISADGTVSRAWVGVGGMVLWPRTECEAGIERAELEALKKENEKLRERLNKTEKTYVVTEAFINAHKTPKGGWNAKQLQQIGITWPPAHGWKKRAVGLRITQEQRDNFVALASRDVLNV